MINLSEYTILINDEKISGFCPTFAIHLLSYSILDKDNIDYIDVTFKSKKKLKILSSKLLFECIPREVSTDDHTRWFYGNKNNSKES